MFSISRLILVLPVPDNLGDIISSLSIFVVCITLLVQRLEQIFVCNNKASLKKQCNRLNWSISGLNEKGIPKNYNPVIINSVRRFAARPSSVLLSATGLEEPYPLNVIRFALIPFCAR